MKRGFGFRAGTLFYKQRYMRKAEEILEKKGVKPTANRIIVMRALMAEKHPVSLSQLEESITTMDKSSIFRALNLFFEKDIVHCLEDGSGSVKYELCHSDGDCSVSDMHVHFYCERCHELVCFEEIPIPEVPLPSDYSTHSINYMIKGLCPRCAAML